MTKKRWFHESKDIIENYFEQNDQKAYSLRNLQNLINEKKREWKAPPKKSSNKIIDELVENSKLNEYLISQGTIIYTWNTRDELTIVNAIRNTGYFTHYSSVFIHQLSLQIPKVYYLNYEHARSSSSKGILTQDSIDNAFSKPQRKTEATVSFQNKKIYLLNSKYTGKLGVIKELGPDKYYHYTDLERTLIDIAVRPAYSGGVFEVIDIYRNAKNSLDPNKLRRYLNELDYTYPYHQVIGFYLQVSGFDSEYIKPFHKDIHYNFYLTYDIRTKEYSRKWKLYYPKGIKYEDV